MTLLLAVNARPGVSAMLAVLAVFGSGCSSYRLGPVTEFAAGARSIRVETFVNRTTEPRLSDALALQLRKRLQQDGTYRLDTKGDADVVVTGTIVDFDRQGLSFQPRDVITPRDYRITIMAQVIARERATGKILLNRRVAGHTNLRVGADLSTTERQAMPVLAEDLARNITSLLVEGEWPEPTAASGARSFGLQTDQKTAH